MTDAAQATIPQRTIALTKGKSEAWVSDQTGHRRSQMSNNYKRRARRFSELGLGELLPLVDALPELMTPASAALGVPCSAP
jgi:hypothetical protein